MVLCKYGCGLPGVYVLKDNTIICNTSPNKCPINKQRNSTSLIHSYKTGKKKVNLFTPEQRYKSNEKNINRAKRECFGENICHLSSYARKYLIVLRGNICEICNISEWNNDKITFEVDHIDGNRLNNVLTNLRVLCPNCHSQTKTWRGRNVNNYIKRVSDDIIYQTYIKCGNIHKTLLLLHLAPKGNNYVMVKRIIINQLYKNAPVG